MTPSNRSPEAVIAECQRLLKDIPEYPDGWQAVNWPSQGWTVVWKPDAPICHMRWTDGLRPEIEARIEAEAKFIAASKRLITDLVSCLLRQQAETFEALALLEAERLKSAVLQSSIDNAALRILDLTRQQEWQPIETAEREEYRSVLGSDGLEVRVTHYDPHEQGWIADMPYTHPTRRWEPTKWRPLPPLPQRTEPGAKQ